MEAKKGAKSSSKTTRMELRIHVFCYVPSGVVLGYGDLAKRFKYSIPVGRRKKKCNTLWGHSNRFI